MGNILPRGIIAKYWQREGKKKKRVGEKESEGSCNLGWILMSGLGIAGKNEWKMCRGSIHHFPPWFFWSIPLFHSLGLPLYMHPLSLSNLISSYIFITPPSLPLPSSSHSVFFLGLFPPGRVADDHTAVFQALIHCRGLVTVQESCSDKAFLWKFNTAAL